MSIQQAIDMLGKATAEQVAAELDRAESSAELLRAVLRVRQKSEESDRRIAEARAMLADKKRS